MRIAGGLATLVACAGLGACKPTEAPPPQPSAPPGVGVIAVESRGITPALSFIGRVKAIQTYQVRARVEGFLTKIAFTDGQRVKKGDLLYQIEKTQYQAAVEQAKANLASAQAVERNAELAFDRAAQLVKSSAGTQATVDQMRANRDSAKASILQNQAALAIANENLGYTDIFSPIDGRIGFTAVTLGNLVNASAGVLDTVVSDDPIYVQFPVSMRQVADFAAKHKGDVAHAGIADIAELAIGAGTAPGTGELLHSRLLMRDAGMGFIDQHARCEAGQIEWLRNGVVPPRRQQMGQQGSTGRNRLEAARPPAAIEIETFHRRWTDDG